jgi:hypothetical protein
MHQVQGLHDQLPYALLLCFLHCLLRTVYYQTVSLQKLFSDHAAGKATLYGAVGKSFRDPPLNGADGFFAGIRKGSAETHGEQKFLIICCSNVHPVFSPMVKTFL